MPSPVHHVFCPALVAEAAWRAAPEVRPSWCEFEELNPHPWLALTSLFVRLRYELVAA